MQFTHIGKISAALLLFVVLALPMVPMQAWHTVLGCHEEITISAAAKHSGEEQMQQQKFNCTCALQHFVSPAFEWVSQPTIAHFISHTNYFNAGPFASILSTEPQSHYLRGPPALV